MNSEISTAIKQMIEENNIILFMKGTADIPQCGFSAATVDVLRKFPYAYKTVDVLSNPEIRQNLPYYSNWPTFPQLFVKGKFIGGCDIVLEMQENGELKKILDEAN